MEQTTLTPEPTQTPVAAAQTTAVAAPPPPTAAAEKELARFTKRRPKKGLILLIVLVLAGGGWFLKQKLSPKSTALPVSVAPLARGELVNMVNLSGVVESADSTKVYSTMAGTIQEVRVEAGAQVEAGQTLALLDTSELQLSIAQQQASMSQLEVQNALKLAADEQAYNDMVADMEAGRNATLVSAQQAVDLAQRRFTDAGRDVTDHKDDMEYADDAMNQLERDLNKARIAREKADKAYKDAQRALDADPTNEALRQARDAAQTAYNAADVAYDDALRGWNKGNDEYGGDLTVWSKTYREARLAYQAALESQEVARQSVQRQLEDLQQSIERTRATSDLSDQQIALKKLQSQLQDGVVKAPVSGTVTAVYADVGAPGNGLMFVIEDTENLQVVTKVREYDIAAVQAGMPVIVKSDATREQEFSGEVRFISPTAVKSPTGDVKTDGSVEFETDVALTGAPDGLRVGMNVRLNIILEKKDNVLTVPFDAVVTNEAGEDIVYVMRRMVDPEADPEAASAAPAPAESTAPATSESAPAKPKKEAPPRFTAEPVVVTLGMETDFSVEVSSSELAEGDQIITNPAGLTPGAEVAALPAGAGLPGMM